MKDTTELRKVIREALNEGLPRLLEMGACLNMDSSDDTQEKLAELVYANEEQLEERDVVGDAPVGVDKILKKSNQNIK